MARKERRVKSSNQARNAFILNNTKYVQYLLPAVSIVITITETWTYPPREIITWILVIIHISTLALMAVHPLLGSNLLLAAFIFGCFIPDTSGPSFLWGTWLALAYIGLYIKPPYGAVYPLTISAIRMWRFSLTKTPFDEYAMLLFIMFLAFFIGRAISWRNLANQVEKDKLKAEKIQQHLSMVRKENIAVSKIHDSASGNLTYMAIMLDNKSARHDCSFSEEEISNLRAMIVKTLEEIRIAINVMNGNDVASLNNVDMPYIRRLQSIAEQGDKFLSTLGFSGKTCIPSEFSEKISNDYFNEVESLLQELYTNTAAHAKPNSGYYISITCKDLMISIDQVNEVSSDSLFPDKPVSGNGLKLHEKRIQSLGGTARTSSEDGTWQFHAQIPLSLSYDVTDPIYGMGADWKHPN